jgi:hypothetical protein
MTPEERAALRAELAAVYEPHRILAQRERMAMGLLDTGALDDVLDALDQAEADHAAEHARALRAEEAEKVAVLIAEARRAEVERLRVANEHADEACRNAQRDVFVAHAERDEVRAQVTAVRALHIPDEDGPQWCCECSISWPCPTIRALDTGVQT